VVEILAIVDLGSTRLEKTRRLFSAEQREAMMCASLRAISDENAQRSASNTELLN
jgi:hypothetical protein